MNDMVSMIIIMIFSGLLSIMSIWANRISDVRVSINDLYMVFLMIGWMILFMGMFNKQLKLIVIGLFLVVIIFISIRNQLFVSEEQFIKGMIPHHSMSILMAKRRKEKGVNNPELQQLINSIIKTQEEEISILKSLE